MDEIAFSFVEPTNSVRTICPGSDTYDIKEMQHGAANSSFSIPIREGGEKCPTLKKQSWF